ncbi:MAG: hypothetical protein JXI43_00735 [Tissierellales bacterium]|nr:hypothetical protein [Tissierellales bacterium]
MNYSGKTEDIEQRERYRSILQKLSNGFSRKEFSLDKSEAKDMVVALDLYNVLETDNVNTPWDTETEKIHHELKKRFSELYNESIYDSEAQVDGHAGVAQRPEP